MTIKRELVTHKDMERPPSCVLYMKNDATHAMRISVTTGPFPSMSPPKQGNISWALARRKIFFLSLEE
jgi:hypothetical protein